MKMVAMTLGGDGSDEGDDDVVFVSGLAPGGNLSGLDLGQGGGPGMKDPGGGQQSRFKWMMEGHSPSSPSPDAIAAMHKNGMPRLQQCLKLRALADGSLPSYRGPVRLP